jgi:DNA-binding transcriptional regulator GbsR (MarR family)
MQNLSPVQQRFVLHWGEMGARWGLSRTVAQVHALLYLSPRPLPADEICDTLGVARSNVSNSLRELQNWGVVRVVHVPGDRRDHFDTTKDVWELFRRVLEVRKQREVDPTLAVLRECAAEAEKAGAREAYTHERIAAMADFFETTSGWYDQIDRLPTPAVIKFVRLGEKVRKLVGA